MAISAKDKAEIERKAKAGIPLAGDQKGNITAESLALWQQVYTANQANKASDNSNQSTGSGVGTTGPTVTLPGSNVVPNTTNKTMTTYGYTLVVVAGIAFVFVSLLSGFRRARGR